MSSCTLAFSTTWHLSIFKSKQLGTIPWRADTLKTGEFTPPALVGPVPLADLQAIIVRAEPALQALTSDEVNGCAGMYLDLQIGPRRISFASETFILSFSLPHFLFHTVNAYDILRSRGRAAR
jgi:uncharacterized protein